MKTNRGKLFNLFLAILFFTLGLYVFMKQGNGATLFFVFVVLCAVNIMQFLKDDE